MVTARRRERPRAGGRDNPSPRPCQHAAGEQYRHRARRLRARFRGQPALLQQSLRALSRDCDSAREPRPAGLVTPALTAVFEVSQDTTRRLCRMVREHLEGQILRFEQRQLLIRAAGRMGIDRFQANLIIAAVQHAQAPEEYKDDGLSSTLTGWRFTLAVFILTQAAIAFAVWRILSI